MYGDHLEKSFRIIVDTAPQQQHGSFSTYRPSALPLLFACFCPLEYAAWQLPPPHERDSPPYLFEYTQSCSYLVRTCSPLRVPLHPCPCPPPSPSRSSGPRSRASPERQGVCDHQETMGHKQNECQRRMTDTKIVVSTQNDRQRSSCHRHSDADDLHHQHHQHQVMTAVLLLCHPPLMQQHGPTLTSCFIASAIIPTCGQPQRDPMGNKPLSLLPVLT